MPRELRKSTRKLEDSKENSALNNIQPQVTPRTERKYKRRIVETPSSDESPSAKSSRSNSMSPLSEKFGEKLNLSPLKTKLQLARKALVDNLEFRLPGREKEFEELSSFLNNIIEKKESGSLYISGAPGTGSK
jgi:DNA replication protein DnaC